LALELSYSIEPINQDAWIDPEVVALAGISAAELQRYKQPLSYKDEGGMVPQPNVVEAPGPHMSNYPDGVYERVMQIPDEAMLHSVPSEPPVQVQS